MPKQTLQMTTVNLSEAVRKSGTEDDLFQIELLYTELDEQSKRTTEAQRAAVEAQALATIAEGQRSLVAVKFLRLAARFSEVLATEHNWLLPRRSGDDILIDNPLTRRDVLAAAKAQHKHMTRDVDPSELDMFGSGEDS